jgi:outer membrane protein assembly factor BamA
MSALHFFGRPVPSPRRLVKIFVAAAALAIPGCSCGFAQTATPAASRLVSVAVAGSNRFTSGQISAAIGLRPGATVTAQDLQKEADRLAQLGLFDNVQYRFATVESGVTVEYQVKDVPTVAVAFDNFPWFTDDELNAALKTSVILYDGTAPQTGTILDAMSAALQSLIETRGVSAGVAHTLINAAGSERRIQQFTVEGGGLNVASVEFSDALAKNDRGIKTRLVDLVGKPFSRSALDVFEFEQVRPVYLAHGFLSVRFEPPKARFKGDPNKPLPNTVVVLASVIPGPAFAWAGVTWKGNAAMATGDLDKLVELKVGDPADGMKIEAMWEKVQHAYGNRGFLEAGVTPAPLLDEKTARVSYVVSIAEGPQYRMGNLVLTGLSLEAERRIRTAWTIAAGVVFDESVYDTFLSSGIKQAFAGIPVHYQRIERFLQTDPKTGQVDVLLNFE